MRCRGCVLVVDDDAEIRDALTDCFEALGCSVVAAVDGIHALECLGKSPKPCLVLLDLNMPRLDGEGFAQFVRAHACHRRLPIVSMSAGVEQLGPPLVECHRSKPFEFSTLMPLIDRLCQDPEWLHGFSRRAAVPGRCTDTAPVRRVCSICERVAQSDGSWAVENLPPQAPLSHGLCAQCFESTGGDGCGDG